MSAVARVFGRFPSAISALQRVSGGVRPAVAELSVGPLVAADEAERAPEA